MPAPLACTHRLGISVTTQAKQVGVSTTLVRLLTGGSPTQPTIQH